MRILVLETHPEAGGGSEAVALQVAAGMRKRGHEVHLGYERTGSLLPQYQSAGVETHQVQVRTLSMRRWLSTYRAIASTARLVNQLQPDVIFSGHLGLIRLAGVLWKQTGVPAVFHLGLPAAKPGRMDRWCRSQVAAGIAPSEHTAASWAKHGWGRLRIAANWVDTDRFKPAADKARLRRSLSLPHTPVILFVGRLVPEKGVELLLRAFGRMKEKTGLLVMVGPADDQYLQHLRALANDLKLPSDRVRFEPPTTAPERWYAAADLVVVPPVWQEPFGLTLLEAMSSGTPVLATPVGILPHILGTEHRACVLHRGGDDDALACLMDKWIAAEHHGRDTGRSLRQRAIQKFSGRESLDCYEEELTAACAKHSKKVYS